MRWTWRGTTAALLPVIVAAAVTTGCGRPAGGEAETASGAPAAVPVEVTVIAPRTTGATVTGTGTIRAVDDVQVSAEASGRVVEIPVTVSDVVEAGSVLVRLDDELAELAVRQARAGLLTAEAELADAELALKRSQSLWDNDDISDLELETAETRATAARAGFATAEAALATAGRQLANTSISAPVSGRVAFVHVVEGQLVSAGVPVAHVVNDERLELDFGVSEDNVVEMRPGQKATVTAGALPGEEFPGRVEYVGPRADDMTKTYPVRVTFANRGRRLRSGMIAEATVVARELRDAILIEQDWLVTRFGEPAVFVAADSIAVLRKVELGETIGGEVVIRSGLEIGDKLISVGTTRVSDGAPVAIKAES